MTGLFIIIVIETLIILFVCLSGSPARREPRLRGVVRARLVPASVAGDRPPRAAEAHRRVPAEHFGRRRQH